MTAIPIPVDQIRNVFQESLHGLTTELKLEKEGQLLRDIVTKDGFSSNALEIYNNWVNVILPQQFASHKLESPDGVVTFAPQVRYEGDGTRAGPMITINLKKVRKTPKMCREHNLSYTIGCYIKAIYTPRERETHIVGGNKGGKKNVADEKEILIGEIPVMLGSVLCWLYRANDVERYNSGECPNDPLGYFIIKGSEKVIIIQEKLRISLPHTFIADAKGKIETRMTCITNTGTKIVNIMVGKTWQTLKVGMDWLRKEHHLPIFVVFRMLGIDIEDAIAMIYKYIPREEHHKAHYALQASIAKANSYPDMVGYISHKLAMGMVNIDNFEQRQQDIQMRIIRDLFPNVDINNVALKLEHLAFMASRTIRYLIGTRTVDNRDSWEIKRLETAGRALEHLMYGLLIKLHEKAQEGIGTGKNISFNFMLVKIQPSIITDEIIKSFGSNSWGVSGPGGYKRENIVDTLKRETPMAVYSQIARVNAPANRQVTKEAVRRLQPTQLGFIDPAETPEGDAVGVVKNLSMTCYISRDHLENKIDQTLVDNGIFELLRTEKDDDHPHPFFKGGALFHWCHGPTMEAALRVLKLSGKLPMDVMPFFNSYDQVMEFAYDGARTTRPLLVVDADGQLVIDKLNLWGQPMSVLTTTGAIEYIDSRQQPYIMLSMTPQMVRDRYATMERLKTTMADPNSSDDQIKIAEETLAELRLRVPFTHSEIDPMGIYGVAVGIMPMPNRCQGPRVTYQASMCKQALNQYHLNHHLRFDTSFKVFQAPTRPFFETEIAQPAGLNFMPAGDNLLVAFMALEDNQEDGIVASSETMKRKFKMVKYMTHRCIAKNDRNMYERFIRPPTKRGEAADKYSAIEDNGLPRLDAYIKQGHCIVGKMRINHKTGKEENASLYVGVGEEGYVDRILITWNAEDQIVIKIKLRQTREQQEGDKFASRYAQKGCICSVKPANQLPRIIGGVNDGVVPHFFINPLSIPSRMTVNKMIEINGSKASAYNNDRMNATGFRAFTLQPSKDTLNAYGLEENGLEYMIRPDGQLYQNQINVSVCHYQMLRHHVLDKIQMRAEGAIRPVSHQPVGGRAYEGGLKIGEMERDAIISHEAIENLWERLCGVSDKYKTVACATCGRIAISNPITGVNICNHCGPLATFGIITIPYALKLLNQLLTACNFESSFVLEPLRLETDRPEELYLRN
jgi:DNA-directed RNA polymerase II subunit RPB2